MAARYIPKPHSTDPDTHETFHFVANCMKHPANLPIDSLTQDHVQTGWCERVKPRDYGALAVEKNSAQQFRRKRRIPWSIQSHLVFFLDFIARMREPLGQFTIVCENEEALGLRIEAADIEETRKLRRKKIKNRVVCVRIAFGRDETSRLIHHDVQRPLGVEEFPVHFHVIAQGRLYAEVRTNVTIDRDASSGDQLIAMPSRANSSRRKEAIETHGANVKKLKRYVVKKESGARPFDFVTFLPNQLSRSRFRFRFGKTNDFLVFLPLTALLEQLDALEAL